MSWQQLLSGFSEKRRQRKAGKAAERSRERELQDAIERVVDEINPRIRALGGYRKKLRPCVARTLTYCSELAEQVPGAVEVSSRSWSKEPTVKAFFSGIEDLRRVVSDNKVIRDYFEQHSHAEQCYAMLSMEKRERTVLGMEMHGELLKRDVKQTTVSFTDHRIVKPSPSETELRKNLKERAFEVLIGYALERITELLAARHSLEEQRRLLEMQVRVAHLKNKSLETLIGEGSGTIDIHALRAREVQTGQELEQARARLTTLDDYIERIAEVLGDPQAHLRLDPISMKLSSMNIKLDEQSPESGQSLEFLEASLGKDLKRILLIARFPREDLLPTEDFLANTSRQ